MSATIPEVGFLRLPQIIGKRAVSNEEAAANRKAPAGKKQKRNRAPKRARAAIPALIPVGKSTWHAGVRSGRFPAPVKIGGATCWRCSDIRELIERLSAERAA
jgi:prophage regulatory protein